MNDGFSKRNIKPYNYESMLHQICPPEKCTGCQACANACPKSCISMQRGKLGHLYPFIDESVCISCGLCEKVCQVNHPVPQVRPLIAYAGWHKDVEEYHSSTSGGVAAALSQNVISLDGVVYGCVSFPGLQIKHIRVDKAEDLPLLKGSKYVQSNMGDVYKWVKKDLIAGTLVLFTGTPCQIAGLKAFLRKDYDNLITVDLICHGTPSQAILYQHLQKVGKGNAVRVQFRNGNDMGLRVFDKDNQMIYYSNVWLSRYKDNYYSTFIDGYTYRESCYQCPFAQPNRCSDITIGDFWGIGKDLVHDTVNGLSVMLPITYKGHEFLKSCNLNLFERRVDEAVCGNDQLRKPKELDVRRRFFRKYYHIFGIGVTYRLCEFDHIWDKWFWSRIKRKFQK